MPDNLFKKMLADYEREITELNEKADELRQQIQEDRDSKADVQRWINLLKECAAINRLDRATTYQLIDHVAVHERYGEYGLPTQSIGIVKQDENTYIWHHRKNRRGVGIKLMYA